MVNKAVIESKEGTKTETEEQAVVASSEEVRTPDDASKVSPKEKEQVEKEPKLFTQKDLEAAVHTAKSTFGRDIKEIEDERDELKHRLEQVETDVLEIQEERDKLQADLEDMSSDDPKKFDLIKRDRELREAQRLLKKSTDDLATEVKTNEERVKAANETLLEISIWDISTEYKGGNPITLKNLCTTLGVTDEAKLREVAESLWEKAEAAPTEKPEGKEVVVKEKLILDPGDTHGSNQLTDQERLDQRYPTMKGK